MLRILAAAWLALIAPQALAEEVPSRTRAAATALQAAAWEVLEPGLSLLHAMSETGARITAFRVDAQTHAFAIAVQEKPEGERVEAFGVRTEALLAVNGGFFGEQVRAPVLYSVGLLRVNGRGFSAAWSSAGGMAVIEDGRVGLRPSAAGAPDGASNVLQSRPMLIEPGGAWAMNTNQGLLRPRSLLCALASGETLIVVIGGLGMSLYEAGWLLRGADQGGFFGCDAALALDGGGSTQLWVAGRPGLSRRGETPVHNALVVTRRAAR